MSYALERIALLDEYVLGTDDFLGSLSEAFATATGALSFILVREDELWVTRAAAGLLSNAVEPTYSLSSEFASGLPSEFASSLSSDLGHVSLSSARLDELVPGLAAYGRPHGLHCIPLWQEGVLFGLVGSGFAELNSTEEVLRLFRLVARRARAAIASERKFQAMQKDIDSRDDVISVVAHDLRNPINVISLAANSLHQRMSDASTRRTVERILRAAHRGDRLIRDLLEVSAIQAGQFAIEKRRIETAGTILAAIESQQGLAASASVILAADVAPELPSIEGDEERLLEVLENLIGNAVKFTGVGGTVIVGATCQQKEILIWVKDTGQGISPEHLPHLFDRFWQARKKDRRGTGLGLTICKGIVEAHGGRIYAESTLGKGTTLFFALPADGVPPLKVKPASSNILLVDDRPENLLSLKAILERPDYRLFTARSGEEALSLALREQFSVALVDVAMPGMDGLEVAVLMKELERSRDIPIIFITAFGDDPEEVHRAYAAGGADYLVKPLDAEIVRKKVAVFVDLNRRRAQEL